MIDFSHLRKRLFGAAISSGMALTEVLKPIGAAVMDQGEKIERRDETPQAGYIVSITPAFEEVYDDITGETHDLPAEGMGSQVDHYFVEDVKAEVERLSAQGKRFIVASTSEEANLVKQDLERGFADPDADARVRDQATLATVERLANLFRYHEPSEDTARDINRLRSEAAPGSGFKQHLSVRSGLECDWCGVEKDGTHQPWCIRS